MEIRSNYSSEIINEEGAFEIINEERTFEIIDEKRAFEIIKLIFDQYFINKNLEDALQMFMNIGTDIYNYEIINIFIDNLDSSDSNYVIDGTNLIIELNKNGLLSSDSILKEIEENIQLIEEITLDIPKIYDLFGIFLSMLIESDILSLNDLNQLCNLLKDCNSIYNNIFPPATKLAGHVLFETKKLLGEREFIRIFKLNKIDLKSFFYRKYNMKILNQWITKYQLECIF